MWERTIYWTLTSFRDAVVRYAVSIKDHHVKRAHTKLQEKVSEETRGRFGALVKISPTGAYTVSRPP